MRQEVGIRVESRGKFEAVRPNMVTLSRETTLNQPAFRLVASRTTRRHLHEFVMQYERHVVACSRAGGENAPAPVSLLDLVDEPVLDMA